MTNQKLDFSSLFVFLIKQNNKTNIRIMFMLFTSRKIKKKTLASGWSRVVMWPLECQKIFPTTSYNELRTLYLNEPATFRNDEMVYLTLTVTMQSYNLQQKIHIATKYFLTVLTVHFPFFVWMQVSKNTRLMSDVGRNRIRSLLIDCYNLGFESRTSV